MLSKPAVHTLELVLEEVTLLRTVEHCKNIFSLGLCLERLFFLITQINCVFSSPVWFECFVVSGGFYLDFFCNMQVLRYTQKSPGEKLVLSLFLQVRLEF